VLAVQVARAGSSPCTFNGGARWLRAVAREREDRPDFIAQHEAVECFIAHQGEGRVARVDPVEFCLARFETVFLQIFELKWSKR
jgi:hypothetical protein